MDTLIANGIDPALLRVLDRRDQERDRTERRRRVPTPQSPLKDKDEGAEPEGEVPKHELDNLA